MSSGGMIAAEFGSFLAPKPVGSPGVVVIAMLMSSSPGRQSASAPCVSGSFGIVLEECGQWKPKPRNQIAAVELVTDLEPADVSLRCVHMDALLLGINHPD